MALKKILLEVGSAYSSNGLFNASDKSANRDNSLAPFIGLKRELGGLGIQIDTADLSSQAAGAPGSLEKADAVVFFEVPDAKNDTYARCLKAGMQSRMFAIVHEPPLICPRNHDRRFHANFRRIMTWNDGFVDGKKYIKHNFVMPHFSSEKIGVPSVPFTEKKLLCMISANKYIPGRHELYTERVRAARFMEKFHPRDFSLYGMWWELPVIHSEFAQKAHVNDFSRAMRRFGLSPLFMPKKNWLYPSFRGAPESKNEVLPKYRFSICYENEYGPHVRGYITEKIMDAFLAGNVPVYWGAENISDYVPKSCFVDIRDFLGENGRPDYGKLYEFLSSVDEKEYARHRESISDFLSSPKSAQFKIDFFIRQFKALVGLSRANK